MLDGRKLLKQPRKHKHCKTAAEQGGEHTWELEHWQLQVSWFLEERERYVGDHNSWDL
jgi:hypothetical protein